MNIDMVRKDHDFLLFLTDNFQWTKDVALKHMNEIRKFYFPHLWKMSDLQIEQGLVNVSNIEKNKT